MKGSAQETAPPEASGKTAEGPRQGTGRVVWGSSALRFS